MKILFVTAMHPSKEFPLRGVIIRRQADALRQLAQQVEILELGSSGGPLRYLAARSRVREALKTFQPDIVHLHFGYGALALPVTSVPIVTTFYGDDLQGTAGPRDRLTWKSRLGIVVSHYAAWRSKRLITISSSLRARLLVGSFRRRTSVIRDAVDPGLFKPLSRDVARRRLGIPGDDVLVIFPHDTRQHTKRLWLAEETLTNLRDTVPTARLWVVNDVPADEMPWYYAASDAMIVTSLLEGGPSSAKEALACGIPVVSVVVGDTELAQDAAEGFKLAEASPKSLARVLQEVLSHTAAERKSFLPKGMTLDEAARKLTTVYTDVLRAQHGDSVLS